jgi:hypothetical protein
MRIVTVADKQLSVLGGVTSIEGATVKSEWLCPDWFALFSGDTSPIVPLLQAMRTAAVNCEHSHDLRLFARSLSAAYRAEREKLIENEILSEYDIEDYHAYLALKGKEQDLFDAITARIHQIEETWTFLVCGFDGNKEAHIFVLGERGKIQYCDIDSFAAIGSGGYAAYIALCSYPYNRDLPLEEACWSVLAAKFAAESAEGVGEQAHFLVSVPKNDLAVCLSDVAIEALREKWRSLPRIPKGVAVRLQKTLDHGIVMLPRMKKEHKHIRPEPKRNRAAKRSDPQKAEHVQ